MIFLGVLFRKEREKNILSHSKSGVSNAANLFQWNVIEGIAENLNEGIHIVNALPVGTWPKSYGKFLLENDQWEYRGKKCYELGGANLPFLKQFSRSVKTKRIIDKLSKTDKEIIIYSAYMPFLKAVYHLPRSVKVTAIITDLPEYYDLAQTSFIRKCLRSLQNKMIYKYMERVDRFVLLTEQMKTPLQVGDRPYVVVEGIYSEKSGNMDSEREYTVNEKIIFYSGTLNYQYGIKTLLDAFSAIKDDAVKLWICGSGEAASEIQELSQKDNRVTYYGFLPLDKVAELRSQASVLVNPRTNEGEYTKYSFPSKTMEYMASGVPVVMHKLSGIPDEYDEFLFYIDGNSTEALGDALEQVLFMSFEDRKLYGQNARKFVLTEKNNNSQTQKIIELIKSKLRYT